ncbi:MAG: hypothetical protein IRD7MM_02530 [Candidatus Midichloria mitochondrii]|nr:hypothetical protein [Candidatus Midichloria mitochondrii]MDJ1287777.1 hypothetical protein [Candidatus Midichloria mitochondrii]
MALTHLIALGHPLHRQEILMETERRIIGAIGAPFTNEEAGQAYVIFGQAHFDSPPSLSSLNCNNGFIINGIHSGDWAGDPVTSAGGMSLTME